MGSPEASFQKTSFCSVGPVELWSGVELGLTLGLELFADVGVGVGVAVGELEETVPLQVVPSSVNEVGLPE